VKSPKNLLILFLALTTVGGAALVWYQFQELRQLRASALSDNDRADLQKRLWAAEKRRHELELALAARSAGPDAGGPETNGEAGENARPGRRDGRGRDAMANNFMAMMDKPEIQKLMAVTQRAALDGRFSSLFKSLNLTPAQLEQFKNLLVDKQTAITDALAAARAQGINPRTDPEDFQKLVADAQAESDASIKATLGDAGYAQYQQYQQTLPQRNVVNQLSQSLSYTNTPLTNDQSEQLIQILAANTPSTNTNGNNTRATVAAAFGVGFGGAMMNTPITNSAITQSATVLAPSQVQALQQLQATQQAQSQLSQAMRNQFRNSGSSSTTPTPTKTGPGGG